MQYIHGHLWCITKDVSIPQAVWIACNKRSRCGWLESVAFQYRKRYGLHAIVVGTPWWYCNLTVSIPQAVWIACNIKGCTLLLLRCRCFNTASGMDCMQSARHYEVRLQGGFQYRKRYGLHAIRSRRAVPCQDMGFNTASGMDCMQFERSFSIERWIHVSIPQAVWIACNQKMTQQ